MKSVIFYLVKPNTGCCGPYWPVYPQGSNLGDYLQCYPEKSDWIVSGKTKLADRRQDDSILKCDTQECYGVGLGNRSVI